MTTKWSKKLAIQHLQELKNPFEETKPGQGNALSNRVSGIAEKIKNVLGRRVT